MEKEEIKKILEKHQKWWNGDIEGVRANLKGANLEGANLKGANLKGANLKGANFAHANLKGANLEGANFVHANFVDANLEGANFVDANLEGANFVHANFVDANLKGANLKGAKNIPEYLIDTMKKDLRYILMHTSKEIEYLRSKLISGLVDGTQYVGACCCLIGTLSHSHERDNTDKIMYKIPYYTKGLDNPSEQLFHQIKEGDTPENNQFAKFALEVIDELLLELKTRS